MRPLLAALLLALSAATQAQQYPNRPVRFVVPFWQGVLVPAGTPPAAVAALSDALLKALAQPEVRERFSSQGLDAAPSTPEQFGAHIRTEIEKWGRIAKSANIRAE